MQTRVLFGIIGALMCGLAEASLIEVPSPSQKMSGIYFFAGWKCTQGELTGQIDGGTAFPLAGQVERPDTEAVCQNDGRNGWIAQYNFNRLDQGTHTFEAFDGLVSFDTVTFEVVHFGTEFKTGVTGTGSGTLSDGFGAELTWDQGLQAFTVIETNSPTPPQYPNVAGTWTASLSFSTENCDFIAGLADLPAAVEGMFIVSQNGAAVTIDTVSLGLSGGVSLSNEFQQLRDCADASITLECQDSTETVELKALGDEDFDLIGSDASVSCDFGRITGSLRGACAGLTLPCSLAYVGSIER